MYTDIPEWSDYLIWWGTALLVALSVIGAIGGVLYLVRTFT